MVEDPTTTLTTPDGRRLGVCEWGDPDGSPVVLLHGSPGSRFLRHAGSGYVDHHLRVVTYDQPGYGLSTRAPGLRVVDAADDVRSVADALGLDRFGVVGISAGGPRALAAAAVLGERVTRCGTVVGLGPLTAPDLDFFTDMDEGYQASWREARDDGPGLPAEAAETRDWVQAGMPGLDSSTEDDKLMLALTFAEAFRQGVEGYCDDRRALVRDWGFRVDDVRVPTRIMRAQDDTSIPPAHAAWMLAHLPDAELVVCPGDHFGPRSQQDMELMAWVGGSTG